MKFSCHPNYGFQSLSFQTWKKIFFALSAAEILFVVHDFVADVSIWGKLCIHAEIILMITKISSCCSVKRQFELSLIYNNSYNLTGGTTSGENISYQKKLYEAIIK